MRVLLVGDVHEKISELNQYLIAVKSMFKIISVVGARPNFMKMAPMHKELLKHKNNVRHKIIHTGQHYDPLMNDVFFRDFEMAPPEIFLGVGSGSHGAQTGRVMIALEEALMKDRPDVLLVVGDINSTVAGALVSAPGLWWLGRGLGLRALASRWVRGEARA
jgi:UDP-N-acetylglucosamine 2-epimerase